MDPDIAADRIDQLLELMKARPLSVDEAEEVSELIANLNDWLERGGYVPTAWLTPSI